MKETHIIGHAYGNNDIANNPPNIPYLQGDVIKIMKNEPARWFVPQRSYKRASPFQEPKSRRNILFVAVRPQPLSHLQVQRWRAVYGATILKYS